MSGTRVRRISASPRPSTAATISVAPVISSVTSAPFRRYGRKTGSFANRISQKRTKPLTARLSPLEDRAQEGARAFVAGRLENHVRLSLLHDHTVVHEQDAVRDVLGELHLVRNDQHRHALAGK